MKNPVETLRGDDIQLDAIQHAVQRVFLHIFGKENQNKVVKK